MTSAALRCDAFRFFWLWSLGWEGMFTQHRGFYLDEPARARVGSGAVARRPRARDESTHSSSQHYRSVARADRAATPGFRGRRA